MAKAIEVTKGSGNVFQDIGLRNPEEALAKAEIARQVNIVLAQRGLSQASAAQLLGVAQPRVSELTRGRLNKFSLEKLLEFAKRSGIGVEIRMKRSSRPRLKVVDGSRVRLRPAKVRQRRPPRPRSYQPQRAITRR